MNILEQTVLSPIDLVNVGFKECPNLEHVYRFICRTDITTVVLSDYNGDQHIFFINPDCTITYFKRFEEIDRILFEVE